MALAASAGGVAVIDSGALSAVFTGCGLIDRRLYVGAVDCPPPAAPRPRGTVRHGSARLGTRPAAGSMGRRQSSRSDRPVAVRGLTRWEVCSCESDARGVS